MKSKKPQRDRERPIKIPSAKYVHHVDLRNAGFVGGQNSG
jgi:hypothetical protein